MNNQTTTKKLGRFTVGMIISVIGFFAFPLGFKLRMPFLLLIALVLQFTSSIVCETFSPAHNALKKIAVIFELFSIYGFSIVGAIITYGFFGTLLVGFSPISNLVIYTLQGRWGEGKAEREITNNNITNEVVYNDQQPATNYTSNNNQQSAPEYVNYNYQQPAINYVNYSNQQSTPNYVNYSNQQSTPNYVNYSNQQPTPNYVNYSNQQSTPNYVNYSNQQPTPNYTNYNYQQPTPSYASNSYQQPYGYQQA